MIGLVDGTTKQWWQLLLTAVIFCAGCPGLAPICQPGATQSCLCSPGTQGVQICTYSGTSWGACVCSTPPGADGGSPPPDASSGLCGSPSEFVVPCADGVHSCPRNATCTPDSASCNCNDGFEEVSCTGALCTAANPCGSNYECRPVGAQPDAGPPSTCANAPTRQWSGAQPCLQLTPQPLQDAANLLTLWDDGPTTICAYNGAAGGFGPCGQLAPQNAFYCSQDDSIAFDGPFLNQLVARFGMFAGTMVIGHEWGHLNQRRLGLLGAMGSYDVNFRNERQADCQAGIFAAFLQSRRVLMMSDAQATYMQFCALGNNSGWFDPGGHGDCPTRATAFLQGYNGAMSSLDGLCSGSAQRRRQIMLTVCPW